MSKIWIDLTDIENWQGQHGGIQRVVYGVTSNFYLQSQADGVDLGYFVFDSRRQCFIETDFEPIYKRVEDSRKSTLVAPSGSISLESKLKTKYKKYIPSRILEHGPTRKLSKKVAKKAIHSIRKGKGLVSSRIPRRNYDSSKPIQFTKEDTVLILGKPWDDLNIQKTLGELKRETGFKLVQVVYDLIIPLYPHLHHTSLFTQYTQHMFEVIATSDLLLPISKSSAKDLKIFSDKLNLTLPEVKVIRLGDNIAEHKKASDQNMPDPLISKDFILTVGTIEIRKNHSLLYNVYKLAEERGINLPQLVIVGGNGWLSHDIQYLIKHDPSVKNKILILKNVSDAGLDWLYQKTKFTIYPSMYEGWGLPIAESLSYGKLCLASGTSSMQEIAGDLLEYFSPYDTEKCLDKIIKYQNETLLKDKEQQITKNYKATTWQDTYKQVKSFV
jgi:glycosyltransferase involved in cell wall biosynthesis